MQEHLKQEPVDRQGRDDLGPLVLRRCGDSTLRFVQAKEPEGHHERHRSRVQTPVAQATADRIAVGDVRSEQHDDEHTGERDQVGEEVDDRDLVAAAFSRLVPAGIVQFGEVPVHSAGGDGFVICNASRHAIFRSGGSDRSCVELHATSCGAPCTISFRLIGVDVTFQNHDRKES